MLLAFAIAFSLSAQEKKISDRLGFGFQLNQYQHDFGLGVCFTSPYFADGHMAFRVKGNYMYLQHPKNDETTWSPYGNITLGYVGIAGEIGGFMRLYGEGGVIFIFPNAEFSKDSYHIGGYGLFGFEFYMYSNTCYFIELGGVGTGATADKVPGEPIYSNGFIISTGFRFLLSEKK